MIHFIHVGMLSKAKGQVLRVAAALHVLFCDTTDMDEMDGVPSVISKEAVITAQNYVDTCCQHAAFIAGRGKVDDEISQLISGI